MFREPFIRLQLFRLNRRKRKLAKEEEVYFKKSKEKKQPEILEEWYGTVGFYEYDIIAWEREKIVSDALLEEADELHLPRPQYGDKEKWEQDKPQMVTDYVLTTEAMAELRGMIRKEKRERRETFESWVKIIGSLITIGTGLVGALIGLVAVWKHK
jgi:hypothetical protein